MKLEHVGIAVKDIEAANKVYSLLFDKAPYKVEEVAGEKVMTSFFKSGKTKIELIAASSSDNTISKYIEKHGEGIHHLAFEVKNIRKAIKKMKKKGFRVLYDEPRLGADNKWVTFLHPKDTHGVLIELTQDRTKDSSSEVIPED